MSKNESIVYIDPFSKVILKASKNSFETTDNYKRYFIGSRVGYNELITHSFKIHAGISKEDLDVQVELKMYEDAGLDTNKKYKINYVEKKLDYEDSFIIEAFAIEHKKTREDLKFVLEKTKYIDFLAIPNLSFLTLYQNKILAPKKDIFVYIDDNEAFVCIYKNGVYLTSSSLPTLNEITKQINKKEFSLNSLKAILKEKGLNRLSYDESELSLYEKLHSVFSDIFYKINNIAMHNRSIFGFDEIERIFITTNKGRIKGLREFIVSIGLDGVELKDFNLFKEKSKDNFFEKIVASYIFDKFQIKDNLANLTFFEKSPAWYKNPAGKFLLFVIFIIFLFGSYPLYLNLYINHLKSRQVTLQEKYTKLENITREVKRKILNIKLQINKIKIGEKKQNKNIINIEKSVNELIDMKSDEKKNSIVVLRINKYLQKYKLSLKSLEQIGSDDIVLEIIAKYDKRDTIAKFMKDLIEGGFIEVSTNEIRLNKDYYISKIKIAK